MHVTPGKYKTVGTEIKEFSIHTSPCMINKKCMELLKVAHNLFGISDILFFK